MIYWLAMQYVDIYPILNVFKYITFRCGLAILTALIISFTFGPALIKLLKVIQNGGQPIRDDGPQTHFAKKGTPTMGGLLMIFSISISTLLWIDLRNHYFWIAFFILISFGLIGFLDDYAKVKLKNSKGVSGKVKLFWQFMFSFIAVYFISYFARADQATHLAFPFFKNLFIDLGFFYLIFGMFVITGASNAVNLTDGLDGLASGPIIIVSMCFAIISYLVGNAVFSEYLQIRSIPNSGEIAIFCAAIVGAALGFLWYNAPPAQIFMGDVGSLSLGGAIGVISVITKHEFVLAIIGGLFVLEALSVMIQVFSFKVYGKRVFKMAPLHHHFEKLGWSETKVVIRFWIISIIFALIGLATLKLR
jgi:phospho-N-acetylmuramoyl-pentapeptide-transferase